MSKEEPQKEKSKVTLAIAKAFEALLSGPIYQVRVSSPMSLRQPSEGMISKKNGHNSKASNNSPSAVKSAQENVCFFIFLLFVRCL